MGPLIVPFRDGAFDLKDIHLRAIVIERCNIGEIDVGTRNGAQ